MSWVGERRRGREGGKRREAWGRGSRGCGGWVKIKSRGSGFGCELGRGKEKGEGRRKEKGGGHEGKWRCEGEWR